MKSIIKYMLLTGVVFLVDTAFANESDECVRARSRVKGLKRDIGAQQCQHEKSDSKKCGELQSQLVDAEYEVEKCDRQATEKKQACTEAKDEERKITEKFSYEQQRKANDCFGAEDDEEHSLAPHILSAMHAYAGMAEPEKPSCLTPERKSESYEAHREFDTRMEKQDEIIQDADKDLIEVTKKTKETVAELQEQRLELQEAFEKAQQKVQDTQDTSLERMRNNQMGITDQIQQLQTKLLELRLKEKNINADMKKALFEKNVQSEGAIKRTCALKYLKYAEERNKIVGGKKTSTSKSGAAVKGRAKKEDQQSFMADCFRLEREIRVQIMQGFEDFRVQIARSIAQMEQQIAQLEEKYKQEAENYNKMIEKNMQRLNQEQQRYYQNDLMLAQKIQQAQENQQLEQARLNQVKQDAMKKKTGFINSRGQLEEAEIQKALDAEKDLEAIEDAKEKNCVGYKRRERKSRDRSEEGFR